MPTSLNKIQDAQNARCLNAKIFQFNFSLKLCKIKAFWLVASDFRTVYFPLLYPWCSSSFRPSHSLDIMCLILLHTSNSLVSSVLLTIWITNRPEHQPLLSSKRIWDLSNNECIIGFKRAGWGWRHRYGSWGEVVIDRATQSRWPDPFLIHTLQFIAMPLLWSQLAHTSKMQMQKNVIPAPKALESRILPPHSVEKDPFYGLKMLKNAVFPASQLSVGQWRYIIECFFVFLDFLNTEMCWTFLLINRYRLLNFRELFQSTTG